MVISSAIFAKAINNQSHDAEKDDRSEIKFDLDSQRLITNLCLDQGYLHSLFCAVIEL